MLEVQSVISLFDKETQTKIVHAFFRAPLYQFRNKAGRHCLGTDSNPSKLPSTNDDPWEVEGTLGMVLTLPLDGTIPLYHLHNKVRHVFTYSVPERTNHSQKWGFEYLGIACYVHATEKPGTIHMRRAWKKSLGDNSYPTTDEAVKIAEQEGYKIDDFHCYIESL